MKKEYIDVTAYTGEGYKPVIDFEAWRVAILRYCEELEVQNLMTMQKHNASDEVFVLLSGNCTLFTGGNGENLDEIDGIVMEPLQLYNVKQGTWHTHTLDREATVLIVEKECTSDLNSPTLPMTEQQIKKLKDIYSMKPMCY